MIKVLNIFISPPKNMCHYYYNEEEHADGSGDAEGWGTLDCDGSGRGTIYYAEMNVQIFGRKVSVCDE